MEIYKNVNKALIDKIQEMKIQIAECREEAVNLRGQLVEEHRLRIEQQNNYISILTRNFRDSLKEIAPELHVSELMMPEYGGERGSLVNGFNGELTRSRVSSSCTPKSSSSFDLYSITEHENENVLGNDSEESKKPPMTFQSISFHCTASRRDLSVLNGSLDITRDKSDCGRQIVKSNGFIELETNGENSLNQKKEVVPANNMDTFTKDTREPLGQAINVIYNPRSDKRKNENKYKTRTLLMLTETIEKSCHDETFNNSANTVSEDSNDRYFEMSSTPKSTNDTENKDADDCGQEVNTPKIVKTKKKAKKHK